MDLLPGARNVMAYGSVQGGEQVLITTDTLTPALVSQALAVAATERGAVPTVVTKELAGLKAYARELIQINRLAARDPDVIATVAPKYMYKIQDASILPFLARAHVEANVWPTDGGFTPQAVGRTMQFLVDVGAIKPGLKPEDVGDYSIVREVLAELGK